MNKFSVWLVPQKDDEKYLSNIIEDLGAKYSAPTFTPHLTLLGDVEIELDALQNIVDRDGIKLVVEIRPKPGCHQACLYA